ncbi:MAG TPA: hypothetical protein VLH85_01890 [Levilinea sp.]|nr:hypothetical protein [Levilinea sp.]
MKKRALSLLILLALLLVSTSTVLASGLFFQVQSLDVEFTIESDGTATIDYTYVFVNTAGGDPIDAVDIGMPINARYALADATAEVNGVAVDRIIESPYVAGIAAEFGSRAIRAGETGRFHIRIRNVRDILYPGEQDEEEPYASFQFQPSYFDSQFVTGATQMTVTLRLPPGLEAHEPTWYTPQNWPGPAEPEAAIDEQGRVTYIWRHSEARADRAYIFGGGFPARIVPSTAIIQAPPPAAGVIATPGIDIGGLLCFAGFAIIFGGIFVLSIYQATVGAKKRKLQYLPPKVSIEGHGVKRGFTSVEAGVLLEQPIDKIMTMILFSTIKKGAASVTRRDPLSIEVERPLPEKLHPYEIEFLEAMAETNKKEQTIKLQEVMVNLISGVTKKMKGFSRKETIDYYQDIMKRAWEQVEKADTPDVQMEKFDEFMGWTMLDGEFDRRTRDAFGPRPVFVPMWWGRYDPTWRSASTPGTGAGPLPSLAPGGGGGISLPHLPGSDFAASMVNGVQSFSAGVVGNLTDFTSSITNRTNPLPPTSTQRSGWKGGGGGCACACACAGCACACAGGGR